MLSKRKPIFRSSGGSIIEGEQGPHTLRRAGENGPMQPSFSRTHYVPKIFMLLNDSEKFLLQSNKNQIVNDLSTLSQTQCPSVTGYTLSTEGLPCMQERTRSIVTCAVDNALNMPPPCGSGEMYYTGWSLSVEPPPESYLLRGPIEQTPVPQGFVSCGVLIHFIIGVRWEPHLQGSDKSQGWVACTYPEHQATWVPQVLASKPRGTDSGRSLSPSLLHLFWCPRKETQEILPLHKGLTQQEQKTKTTEYKQEKSGRA